MKVRYLLDREGGRFDSEGNRLPLPKRGDVVEVDDLEGAHLCAGGWAVPVADTDTESASAPDTAEKRGRK